MEMSYDQVVLSGEPVVWDDVNWDMSIFDDLLSFPVEPDSSSVRHSCTSCLVPSCADKKSCQNEKVVRSTNVTKVAKSTSRRSKKKIINPPVVVTRTPQRLKLFSFPSFDKSDALIYLPSTMARLSNCGDIQKFTHLMKNYCTKDCAVTFDNLEHPLPLLIYLDLIEVGDVFYPDNMMCMHSTRVVENQIQGTLYYKYTDIPEMYLHASLIPGVSDNKVHNVVFVGDRKELLARNFQLNKRPGHVREQLSALFDKGDAFEVYGKEHVTFTFNPHSKKIVRWHTENTLTYLRCEGAQYDL